MQNFTAFVKHHLPVITIGSILLLAAFMRFYRLGILPPGLHPDEAANGLDIFRMFDHHDFRPLYNTNGPREALFFYLQAIFVGLMGNTVLALRMAPALIGTLGVGATYLWAKEWFGPRAGVLAAFIMAVLPWAITISRDGFRASMMMLMVPLTLWLYTKAFKTGKLLWFTLAGISFGAGFYTYLSFRLFPAAVFVIALYMVIWRRNLLARWWRLLLISLAAMIVVLLPLGIFAIQHPADIGARTTGVSFLNKDLNHGHPWQTLGSNIVKTALMFNVHGDENYRQNLGGQPELNIFVGAMFILGILVALSNIARLPYFGLIMVFGVMLLPEALTAEGIPHALRAIGALPPTVVLAALGIIYLIDRWYAVFPINSAARSAGTAALVVLLGLTAIQGYVQYFIAYANDPKTYEAYSEDSVAIGTYLNTRSTKGDVYVVAGEYQTKPIEYLTHYHTTYHRIEPNGISAMATAPVGTQFILPENTKDAAIKALRPKYPKLSVSPHYSRHDQTKELFVVYTVGASG